MKIVVAIPVYDGKLPIQTAKCLFDEKAIACANGDDLMIRFQPNCSHPAMGRNQLAQEFMDMDSDAERLVFLDSDVTFEPGALIKLAYMPADFVGGCYRHKQEPESYPIGLTAGENWTDAYGLMEVESLPGGFLALSRRVFRDLALAYPERKYSHFGKAAHCWFQMQFRDGNLYGEDSGFCEEWRALGNKIYLDPEIKLTHWNFKPVPYEGHIGNWMKNRTPHPVPAKGWKSVAGTLLTKENENGSIP